jgi:preprotein translocase subunit SecF
LIKTYIKNDKITEEITKQVKQLLLAKYLNNDKNKILQLSVVGPSFGQYIKSSAQKAIFWGMVLMAIYILFAFIGIREYISPLLLA